MGEKCPRPHTLSGGAIAQVMSHNLWTDPWQPIATDKWRLTTGSWFSKIIDPREPSLPFAGRERH